VSYKTTSNFSSLITRHLLSTLFSYTLNPCSSLRVKDYFTDPYAITGKFNILYISISGLTVRRNPIFYITRRFITLYIKACHGQDESSPEPYILVLRGPFNIILPFTATALKSSIEVY
jgi:hypothetical protein